jgi:hypothetical protein
MRLRRIEPSKTASASAATSASASAPAASTSPARSAKSSSAHHPTEHSHYNIRHVACSSTLPLRLRNRILHPLPNVVLAITR